MITVVSSQRIQQNHTLVESEIFRQLAWLVAQMPLAGNKGRVACVPQYLCKAYLLAFQRSLVTEHIARCTRRVYLVLRAQANTMLILSGHQRSPCGCA